MKPLLEVDGLSKRFGGLVVIPVLLRPASLLDSPFADLKPLPGDGRPISQWSDRDAALVDVVAGVRLHVL